MSIESIRENIVSHFKNNFNGSEPIEWPNRPIEKPENGLWMRFAVSGTVEDRAELGRSGYEGTGAVIIQVFAPKGTGTKNSLVLADAVSAIFRNTVFNSITFDGVDVDLVGPSEGWHQTNVFIPFEVDLVY